MIHISDRQRTFPIQQITYAGKTVDDIYQEGVDLKHANCPKWNDDSPADFGNHLLWLLSVMTDMSLAELERHARDNFIGSTQDRPSMQELCRWIGYAMSEASPAAVIATFTCLNGHLEFTIPAGTQIATVETSAQKAIVFETVADQIVAEGVNSVNINCLQGQTISGEIIGSSDGSADLSFTFSRKPVIWHSETISVYEAAAWVNWTRVDSFVFSNATDRHYRIEYSDSGICLVVFGNGVNGKIPPRGATNIRVTYRIGGGTAGNVGAASITEITTPVNYVTSVTNAAAASGGSDRETLDHARVFAPGSIRTMERAVTTEDIAYLCRQFVSPTYGGIANAKAYTIGGSTIKVIVVPQSGGLPSAGLKNQLAAYLDSTRMICSAIQVIDPVYLPVGVTISIFGLPNYAPSQIIASVRDRIVGYLSSTYQDPSTGLYPHDFGRNIRRSDLYRLVEEAIGVDYCDITAPNSDIIVGQYQIADMGTITLDITTPSGETAHFESGQ